MKSLLFFLFCLPGFFLGPLATAAFWLCQKQNGIDWLLVLPFGLNSKANWKLARKMDLHCSEEWDRCWDWSCDECESNCQDFRQTFFFAPPPSVPGGWSPRRNALPSQQLCLRFPPAISWVAKALKVWWVGALRRKWSHGRPESLLAFQVGSTFSGRGFEFVFVFVFLKQH